MTDLEGLELEIDLRMRNIWADMRGKQSEGETMLSEEQIPYVAALCRAAYGKGYEDALREPVRGQLHITCGYAVPERRGA